MEERILTIFTPTYNRGKYLKRLYDSLKAQTEHDFEWLVVDDGSSDNTQEIMQKFMRESVGFPIKYYKKGNGGKHTAINKGVQMAVGSWFFILDSDDTLLPDAVSLVKRWIDEIENLPDMYKYAGIAGLRESAHGIIGGKGNGQSAFIDATNLERRKFQLTGDKAEVYRTEILKKYPFPEFEGETFLSEEVVWDEIAYNGYIIRWFLTPIYRCEYLQNGLTRTLEKQRIYNFEGFTYQVRQALKNKPMRGRVHMVYEYADVARKKGMSIWQTAKRLKKSPVYVLGCCFIGRVYELLYLGTDEMKEHYYAQETDNK